MDKTRGLEVNHTQGAKRVSPAADQGGPGIESNTRSGRHISEIPSPFVLIDILNNQLFPGGIQHILADAGVTRSLFKMFFGLGVYSAAQLAELTVITQDIDDADRALGEVTGDLGNVVEAAIAFEILVYKTQPFELVKPLVFIRRIQDRNDTVVQTLGLGLFKFLLLGGVQE